ncbi:alpha/beta fold hydrolase [Bordetella bronchiseptica]|uniref:alpha/beta fold hydrolase n=1 Tax=Bordetella bronchiseptica TaxID=518 RepID=UPI000460C955|nr:alpha/beta hydrolase [Bordetella bronchiseptica]KDC79303.1 alpha/beta hydrolase family protein [Bordetella bronchiseptica MBORD635]
MATAIASDGVRLHYETTGAGTPVVFVHEFAGNLRSWEPQVRHFARQYQCIRFNARGYPPSEVPESVSAYSQAQAVRDIVAVMDAVGAAKAHVVGLSMGGFAALHLGLTHPERALSLCVAGAGYGAEPGRRDLFRQESETSARLLLELGMPAFAERYTQGPTRMPFLRADPLGFAEFVALMKTHSALGSANTQLGVQRERPSLYELEEQLGRLTVPTLILNGDEDWPCLAPGLMLKRVIPSAALSVIPNCGHTINLEASEAFNRVLGDFMAQAASGRWPQRDPRAMADTITGMSGGKS